MREAVLSALLRIEAEAQVRVLLAVESGSRAWGFASPDSDYDVRFLYVHAPPWYLTVYESRDVIEQMLPGDLDVSGWELRKSLRLFSKCNLALNEWLGSPEVYREEPGFRAELCALMPSFFNPISATHHYRSMAQQALDNLSPDQTISAKKLLYAYRALLACRWIARHQSQPPTEFQRLVDDVADTNERTWLRELVVRKSTAAERTEVPLDPRLGQSLAEQLEAFARASRGQEAPLKSSLALLDAFLNRWVVRAG